MKRFTRNSPYRHTYKLRRRQFPQSHLCRRTDDCETSPDSFYGLDISGFKDVFDLNFQGTVLATMIFTRDMVKDGKGGNVLNISSMNSIRPLTKIPAYSAAKGAINNFTQWYSVHVAPLGIRCNAIAPGFFLTNQNRFLLTDEKTGELKPRGKKIISNTPMHKFGEPEDLVGTMLYLLSDISSFVTGTIIPVDGGYAAFGGVYLSLTCRFAILYNYAVLSSL